MNAVWGYLCILGMVMGSITAAQETLVNRAVYTFQNKGDFGFLTSIGKAKFADSDRWRDSPTQKWRVVKGYLGSSYMLKPTSDENISVFVDGNMVGVEHSGFALSSSQYWTVWQADQGFYIIRNSQTDECLESPGLGKRVITSRCRNIREQQWAMHRR
ncbi:uncharacterized protein LOC110851473 [Folsomia candida]|uniref:uncharacterized protein LOC110851473 n=1 Tax=Folsomia candida TaxID=158441 RepID=UPI000B8FFAB3|nr:uncharacterized protein LOC110851473 [Folsomia candida]